jgi:hypothetical protein
MADRHKLAISLQRIGGKLLECEFFLERVEDATRTEDFGYYLSAFLAALSTFTDLALITRYAKGAKQARKKLLEQPSDLGFLLNARHVEVHQEGVRIWCYRGRYGTGLWSTVAAAGVSQRNIPRYTSRYPRGPVPLNIESAKLPRNDAPLGFIFHDSGRDVVTCCHRALAAARRILRG